VDDTATVTSGESVTLDPSTNDTDADGDALTVTVPVQPTHGTVTLDGNDLTYTPDAGYEGPDTIAYTVCDTDGACDTGTIAVTVTNAAPVASDDSTTVTSGGSVTLDPAANDTDADGDALTVTVPAQPAHGVVTLDGNDVTYAPLAGFVGTDTFGYTVCDTDGACDTGTVTVLVTGPPNAAPVAVDDVATTVAGVPVTFDPTVNDTDPDGDTLVLAVPAQPAHGTVTVDGNDVTYTPDAGYVGTDTIAYTVCDGADVCDTGSVLVTVAAPPNTAPVAADDTATVPADGSVTFDPTVNDSDADGDALALTVPVQPAHGTVTVDGHDVTYVPAAGFSGTDTVTYTVCDPTPACDTAVVTVTVQAPTPGNRPPVADAGPDRVVDPGDTVRLDGRGSSDPDLDPLTYLWVATLGADHVEVTGATTARPTVRPLVAGPAKVVFLLTVSDGTATSTDTVTVFIERETPPAEPPVTCQPMTVTSPPAGVVVDPACTPGTTSIAEQPAHGTLTVLDDGSVRYVPDAGYAGTDSFVIRVCSVGCATSVVTVRVPRQVVRPRAVPRDLPRTGGPGSLVPIGVVLVLAGAALQRRRVTG
jgi:hypothetical protein